MKRLTNEEVCNYLSEYGFVPLEEYKNIRAKMRMMCPNGHKLELSFSLFKHQGIRCKYCSGNYKRTKEDVKKYLHSIGYEMLSDEYVNNNTKIKVRCDNGHETEMTIHSLKSGQRCKYCAGNNIKHTYDEIKNIFAEDGYTLIDKEYKNNKVPLNVICPYGHQTKISLVHFCNGVRCQKCGFSSGETEIMNILDKNNILYDPQHTFDECKDKQVLPFDFYIYDKNTCIEYDGAQHFKPISTWGGEKYFEDRKRKDEIKNKYCEDNGIKLIRIPYWDFNNIEQILKDEQIIN